MIECITGRPGAGKSLYGCVRLLRAIKQGRSGYSNLYPRWSNTWRWANWDTMSEAGEGLYVVDEAQVWFNSRDFAKNTSELHSWQQSRKRGADLVWIAQHENRVDVAIRELTSIMWKPRIVGPVLLAFGSTLEGEKAGVDFAFPRSIFGAYHTDQVIGGRSDKHAVLARVTNPQYVDAPLYAACPTHAILADAMERVTWAAYVEGIRALVYGYKDYSGDMWELQQDEVGWKIVGRISSPEATLLRYVRARLLAGERLLSFE